MVNVKNSITDPWYLQQEKIKRLYDACMLLPTGKDKLASINKDDIKKNPTQNAPRVTSKNSAFGSKF